MRVVVVGTSGSGKTTFATRLSEATGLLRIELDELNWRPGWHSRSEREPEAFIADVAAACAGPAWVCSGGYSKVRSLLWSRATDLVWLDLSRFQIMLQVVPRSLQRALSGRDVFPGCRENLSKLFEAEHPIRWAWDTHARRRREFGAMLADPAYGHLKVWRCPDRRTANQALDALVLQAHTQNAPA